MWSGGHGAPGRQLLAVLPAIALGFCAVDARLPQGGGWRRAWDAALWFGIAHAHLILFVPPLAFESAKAKVQAACAGGLGLDPLAAWPALGAVPAGAGPGWLAAGWLAALAVAWAALYRRTVLPRRPSGR
jgi:hypothetical protein